MVETKAYVELRFEPNWTYISAVRNFVENFISITLDDKRAADRIAMSVNELVENAIKYSDLDGVEIRLDLLPTTAIRVVVRNHALPEQAARLAGILAAIAAKGPLEAYLDRMREASLAEGGKGSLGLARVRYEAAAELSMEHVDGFVTVTAVMPQTLPEGADGPR